MFWAGAAASLPSYDIDALYGVGGEDGTESSFSSWDLTRILSFYYEFISVTYPKVSLFYLMLRV